MKFLAAFVLCLLASCSSVEARNPSVRLQFEGGVICTGTPVGRNIILTADHCTTGRLLAIDNAAAYTLEVVRDGKDHALLRVSKQFTKWARAFAVPYSGMRVSWYGNAAGEPLMYREAYVIRVGADEVWFDGNAFGGDSGAAMFDSKGRIVAVLTGGRSWRDEQGWAFSLVRALPMAFTPAQWQEIAA